MLECGICGQAPEFACKICSVDICKKHTVEIDYRHPEFDDTVNNKLCKWCNDHYNNAK